MPPAPRRLALASVPVAWSFWSIATVATLWVPTFGIPLWHYTLAFAVMTLVFLVDWPAWSSDRRLLGRHLLVSASLAIVSGFFLLYFKDWTKAVGIKDWAKFWHCAWSAWLILILAGHIAVNLPALSKFLMRLRHRMLHGAGHVVAWSLVLAFLVLSVGPGWRTRFTEENYLYVSTLVIAATTAVFYGGWIAWKLKRGGFGLASRRGGTRDLRANVDWALLGFALFANGSGFALLYAKDFLHGNGFKYVAKWWHTAPSVAFTALLAVHLTLNLALMLGYWRAKRGAARLAPVSATAAAAPPPEK